MKTKTDIVKSMDEAMPYELNPNIVNYIIEAMDIYANQQTEELQSKLTKLEAVNRELVEALEDIINATNEIESARDLKGNEISNRCLAEQALKNAKQ